MLYGNFAVIKKDSQNDESPNPFVAYYQRQAERRELLKQLCRELWLNRDFYGVDANFIINSKVNFK